MRLRIAATICFALSAVTALAAQPALSSSGSATSAAPAAHGSAKPIKSATAQKLPAAFDATNLGSPLLLDKNWRVGISADPAAGSPAYDDSQWRIRDAKEYVEEVDDESENAPAPRGSAPLERAPRFAWFRLHIRLAPNHGPLALLIDLPVSENTTFNLGSTPGPTPDVFANGRRILPEGPHGDAPSRYQQISRIYNLNIAPSETSLVLAVRTIYMPFGRGAYTGFFSVRKLYLGNHADLQNQLDLWSNHSLFERLPRLIYSAMLAVLAVFLFALYFAQKGHNEYLWLALHELVQAPIAFVELAGSSAHIDRLWYSAISIELELAAAYLFYEFLVAFLGLKRRWYINLLRYTAPILAFAGPVMLFVSHRTALLLAGVAMGTILWLIGWSLFIFITLIAATLRRNFEAGLLLIPLVLSLIGMIEPILIAGFNDEPGALFHSPLTILAGPVPIHFASIANFAGILAIVIIIFFRYLRIQREKERVSNELEAARSVQELLIPREKVATPGFEVDPVYYPANEVGGDFFHVQPDGLDGVLVVIGDVAGKGLKAAMDVSLLMGALRRTLERSPAAILASLNRVLCGTGSFTTCQAIWFGANGEMVIANAGHLPPYLNSQEIKLPGGLPLGVLADISYEEARFFLHPGDRILMLSDGVVEARQPSGELFGFERLKHFSQQSAFYIAEAAKSFGQQDDITVLTVRRQANAQDQQVAVR